jgi:predicted carbohydrate-binding protein with CBM5 and CBM33 domain
VKVGPEVCQVVSEYERLWFRPFDLPQFLCLVKGDLCMSRLQLKCGVPRSSLWSIEATAGRVGVGKCGIYDGRICHAEEEFMDADTRKKVRFPEQPVVRGAIELK